MVHPPPGSLLRPTMVSGMPVRSWPGLMASGQLGSLQLIKNTICSQNFCCLTSPCFPINSLETSFLCLNNRPSGIVLLLLDFSKNIPVTTNSSLWPGWKFTDDLSWSSCDPIYEQWYWDPLSSPGPQQAVTSISLNGMTLRSSKLSS